jgi:hypothetical protein
MGLFALDIGLQSSENRFEILRLALERSKLEVVRCFNDKRTHSLEPGCQERHRARETAEREKERDGTGNESEPKVVVKGERELYETSDDVHVKSVDRTDDLSITSIHIARVHD